MKRSHKARQLDIHWNLSQGRQSTTLLESLAQVTTMWFGMDDPCSEVKCHQPRHTNQPVTCNRTRRHGQEQIGAVSLIILSYRTIQSPIARHLTELLGQCVAVNATASAENNQKAIWYVCVFPSHVSYSNETRTADREGPLALARILSV